MLVESMAFLIIAWLSVSMVICLALLRAAARPLPPIPIQQDRLEETQTFVLAEAGLGEEPELAPRAVVAAMLSTAGK
jgi:hypothetical protein